MEFRLPDGTLVAYCQYLQCGSSLVGGVYACDPEVARSANSWQGAVGAGLALMAERRLSVLNCGPTYGHAKQLVGLSPLPLRVAIRALWEAAPAKGAWEGGGATEAPPAGSDECVSE